MNEQRIREYDPKTLIENEAKWVKRRLVRDLTQGVPISLETVATDESGTRVMGLVIERGSEGQEFAWNGLVIPEPDNMLVFTAQGAFNIPVRTTRTPSGLETYIADWSNRSEFSSLDYIKNKTRIREALITARRKEGPVYVET